VSSGLWAVYPLKKPRVARLSLPPGRPEAIAAKKPHIVFILADDPGWRDRGLAPGAEFLEPPTSIAL